MRQHQGELYMALGGDRLEQADLVDGERFRSAWEKATKAINVAKRRRFADFGAELFAPFGRGGDKRAACTICGYQGDAVDPTPVEWTTVFELKGDAPPPTVAEPYVEGFKPVANATPTMTEADMMDWKSDEEGEPKPMLQLGLTDSLIPRNLPV